jgi:hypothetical protein
MMQKVIVVENIARDSDIYIDAGMARVAIPSVHRPVGRAVQVLFKGELADFDAARKELKRAKGSRGKAGTGGQRR